MAAGSLCPLPSLSSSIVPSRPHGNAQVTQQNPTAAAATTSEQSPAQQGHSVGGQRWYERFAVGIVFIVFVVFRAADRAFIFRVGKYLNDSTYNLILFNVIWPVSIQIMTIVMLLGYICLMRMQGEKQYTWRFFLPGNAAASSTGPVPLYRLALFSLGDQLNTALSAPPNPYIALPIQSLMSNLVLVWMLVLASIWLGTKFKQVHYIGCVLIIVAVVVGLSNKFQDDDCSLSGLNSGDCLTSYKNALGKWVQLEGSSMALWFGLFILSTVPSAFSNCYKQKVLKGVDLDVVYATWWSGNFQVLWGLLLFWVNWIPLPDQPTTPPSSTFAVIGDTWQCLLGNVPQPGQEFCKADGGPAIKWFIIYLFFNLTFNVCLLWLTKRMSAVWAQIATTLCLDLTNIFSQYKALVGDSAQWMSISQWLATVLASIALWTYNLEPEVLPGDGRESPQHISEGQAPLIDSFTIHRCSTNKQHFGSAVKTPQVAQGAVPKEVSHDGLTDQVDDILEP